MESAKPTATRNTMADEDAPLAINVPLVVNRKSTAREVRLTDAALPRTEPVMLFCILSTDSPFATTLTTSLSTSLST